MPKQLYTSREIEGHRFILAEHLEDYVSAQVAAAEYRADRCRANQMQGWLCRVEVVEKENLYYIWVGNARARTVRTLPHENIHRSRPRKLTLAMSA